MDANQAALEKFLFVDSNFFSKEAAELLQRVYFIIPNWKWIHLFGSLGLILLAYPLFRALLKFFIKRSPIIRNYPNSFWANTFKTQIGKSIAFLVTILLWAALVNMIDLPPNFEKYLHSFFKGLLAFSIIRIIYHLIDAAGTTLLSYSTKNGSSYDNQLIPFAEKTLKFVVVVLGILIVLQSVGLNVASLLAGLGLGGLAIALAAQDTAANLFGSITILLDRPFAVGDLIKVKELEGTVEEIGLRSTRIRTLYNSIITVPNGTMAKEYIDNMGVRPARRTRLYLGLTYDTPPEKISAFCSSVRDYLLAYEEVISDSITVTFNRFSDSSLDILINFHLQVVVSELETKHQQIIFLEFLKIAKSLNVEFAFPSRTLYHVNTQENNHVSIQDISSKDKF